MALSRDQMIGIINGGGSVLVDVGGKKKLVASIERLPSEAQMARTEKEKLDANDSIDQQIAALQAQKFDTTKFELHSKKVDSIDDTLDELMKHTRAELVEKASELGLEVGDTDTKTQISEAILNKQSEPKAE